MTTIDAILAMRQDPYMLAIKRTNKNAFYSIDKLTEAQAAEAPRTQHNQRMEPDTKSKDVDFKAIVEQLKLFMPANRLKVLMRMKAADLLALLETLQNDKMVIGLKFFNKKKLLGFVLALPKEDLLKMLLKIFSKEELVAMMPMKEFKKFFESTKISQDMFIKVFKTMPKHLLAQILEGITGVATGNQSQEELIKKLGMFNKSFLIEGIMGLGKKQVAEVAGQFIKMDENLMSEFSKAAFFRPIAMMPKNAIAGLMEVLKPEQLIGMLSELPQNMMAQLGTLVDPSMLSEALLKSQKGLLASLVA